MEPATIAEVLLAVTPGASKDNIPSLLVKQLEQCSWEEKAPIARSLVEILKVIPNAAADQYLSGFIQNLVFAPNIAVNDRQSANVVLAVKLVLAYPKLLQDFNTGSIDCLGRVISIALATSVSSDDGFTIPSNEFLEMFESANGYSSHPGSFDEEQIQKTQEIALGYLKFYEVLLMAGPQGGILSMAIVQKLFFYFLVLLGYSNRAIVHGSGKVLRLLLQTQSWTTDGCQESRSSITQMIYHRLQDLTLGATREAHEIYALWLQWVSTSGIEPSQEILQEDRYWGMLQQGMLRGFSAQRKICLQILNTSINHLKQSFNNEHFIWDEKSKKGTIQAWKKYATLFEIIVFDTSANQLKDALPEFRRLLTPPLLIHGSWFSVLLALALKNSSSSIQSTAFELVLSLEWQQLAFLNEEKDIFLTDYLLPYALMGCHFSISGEHNEKCEHGEKLSKFIAGLTRSSPEAFAVRLVDTFLSYIIDRPDSIFSPARIYILLGLVLGLEKRQILGQQQLVNIVRVASNKRFSRTRAELATLLCLRLLLSVKCEDNIEAKSDFFQSLYQIVKGCERIFGLKEAESFAQYILGDVFKYSTTHGKDMNGTDFGKAPKELMTIAQTGGQKALLYTLLLVTEGVDETSIYNLLGWTGDDATFLMDISSLFDFGHSLVDKPVDLLSSKVFRNQILNIICEYTSTRGPVTPTRNLHVEPFSKVLRGIISASQRSGDEGPLDIFITNAYMMSNAFWKRQLTACQSKIWWDQASRPHMLAVCSSAAKLLEKHPTPSKLPINASQVLEVLEQYPRLVQGNFEGLEEGSYVNSEITKVVESAVEAAFSLLASTLNLSATLNLDQSAFDGQQIIACISRHLRFITNKSLPQVMSCLKAVVMIPPSELSGLRKSIVNCLVDLWELSEQTRSGSDVQGAYVELFELLFNPALCDDSTLEEINRVAKEALKLSVSRRSIAPALARALSSLPSEILSHYVPVVVGLINLVQLKEVDHLQEESLCGILDRLKGSRHGTYYNYYNGDREIVTQARIYDLLSRLDPNHPPDAAFVRCLRRELLDPWQEAKSAIQFSADKKTSQLQALLVTDRFVGPEEADEFLQKALDILNVETHPRYRFLFEWMVTMVVTRLPGEMERIWKLLDFRERLNPRTQVSVMKIAMMLASSVKEGKQAYYERLVNAIVPLISNSKVTVRHLAITSVLAIWKDATELELTSITTNPLLQQIREQILNSQFYLEATIEERRHSETVFNPLANYTLLGIFHGSYLLGGDFIERITKADFLAIDPARGEHKYFIPLGTTNEERPTPSPVEYTRTVQKLVTGSSPSTTTPLQTKSGTWTTDGLPRPTSTSTPSDPNPTSNSPPAEPQDILLLASLIQNPTNLGGLSRVAEIFGASSLAISSLKHLSTKDFLSVSVSSEHWLPIQEVPVADLQTFIRAKKVEGYTIVGIEQTDQSVVLGRDAGWRMPRKAVLMLGSEREGIPAGLLGEVDLCVEIRQRGETRSLNVQTAAAVVCFEWDRQWRW